MSLVAVGGAIYSGTASGKTSSENAAADFFDLDAVAFPQLPGSKQEVQSIGSIVSGPSKLLLEGDATETAFKALPLENFRIVHLAVHGIANAQFPDRAALILGTSTARRTTTASSKCGKSATCPCGPTSSSCPPAKPAPANFSAKRESQASNALSFSPVPKPSSPASGPLTTSTPSPS